MWQGTRYTSCWLLVSLKGKQTITETLAKDAMKLVLWHWREILEGYDETHYDAVEAFAEGARLTPSFGTYLPSLSMKNTASEVYFESALG